MLILQRKKGEALVIGDNIRVTVLDAGSDCVRLAVEAPSEIRVLREELLTAAKINRQAAAAERTKVEKLAHILEREKE